MSDLNFNEESYYCEVNTSDNEDFCFTILHSTFFILHFRLSLNRKKRVVMRAMRRSHASAADLSHIRIENLD